MSRNTARMLPNMGIVGIAILFVFSDLCIIRMGVFAEFRGIIGGVSGE